MKLRVVKIIALIVVISTIVYSSGLVKSLFRPSTAYAISDLMVNWGVPEGNPIFVVSNFAPGQSESRTVEVSNGATAARPVGVRGNLASESASLSTVLDFVIRDGATDVYGGGSGTGPKTLAQFFSESATISGIPLSTIAPGGSKNFSFIVTFMPSAGNEFQNSQITFDLHIGVFFEVPSECGAITFSGNPIFGTEGNDRIRGTNKSDMIVSFSGNDVIDGGNNKDCVLAGDGNNNIDGGNDADVIVAGNGNNTIDGGNGNDQIFSGNGNDTVFGGNSDDNISTGQGNDKIDGGNGKDQIDAGGGDDAIKGGNGSDALIGGAGIDNIDGGNGADSCDAETETHCEL